MDNTQDKPVPSADAGRRLLVVSQHFWPETFRINDVVEGLTAAGHSVDVLCGMPNYPKGEWFKGYNYFSPRKQNYAGAEVFRSGEIRRKNNTSLRIFLNYISFPFFALFSLPRLAGRKYDAVFCYETSPVMMMFPAIIYAKTHRIPLVTYVLDLWPENLYSVLPLKSPFLRSIAQKVSDWHYKKSTRLIAMSDKLALHLQEVSDKNAKDIAVIPQYSEDFYATESVDEELNKRYAGFFNILFTGNISPAQDLDNLVFAMEKVRAMGHDSIRCLLVGDGMSRQSLQELINEKGLSDAFVFCGSCPPTDIPKWTTLADALFAGLASSQNLGLTVPAKITSYFAAGKPLLVAADGEAARVSDASGSALVSPAGNSDALAENIISLAQMSNTQRKTMGDLGHACYQEHYTRKAGLAALQAFIFANSP